MRRALLTSTLFLLFTSLIFPGMARAQVSFQTSASGSFTTTSGTVALNLSGVSTSNNMLVVGISEANSNTVSSMTWNGAAMALVSGCSATGSSANSAHIEIWRLANPALVSSSVAITFSASPTNAYVGAALFANVSAVGTCVIGDGGTGSTSNSLSPTVPANGAAFDAMAVNTISSATITVGSGQTTVSNLSASESAGATSYKLAPVTTMSDSWNTATSVWAHGAVPLNPVTISPPTITKAFSPTSVATGTTSGLTLTITNPNASTTLTGIAITDGLPTGMTQTGAATTCTSGSVSTSTSTSIVLTGGSIAGGGSCTVTATVSSTTLGSNVNTTGTVSSTNGGTGTTASATLSVYGPASKVVFTTEPPSSTTAGSTFSTAVSVEDSNGDVVQNSSASVTVAITSGTGTAGAVLNGTTTVSAVNGVATFSGLSINTAGTGYTLTATSGSLTSGVSSAFAITATTASKLAFTTEPSSSATGGTAFAQQPTVTVEDQYGNTVTTSTASITLAITSGTGTAGAALSCTTNPKSATAGVDTFAGCSINLAGTGYTLTATSTGLTSAVSTAINVSAGAAAKLAFTVQPSNSTAGVAIGGPPTVSVEDAGGNVVTTSSASITLAIGTNPGGGTLTCTTNPVTASSGVAAFSTCSINKSGTGYTLTATSSGLTTATSSTFNITAGTATQLAFTQEPSTPDTAGTAFGTQPKVSVEDANGNVVTTDSTDQVTLAITSGTGTAGATLTCTTNPVTVASGVATFAGCNINLAGSNYTMTATSGSYTSAVSTAFTVNPGAASKLIFTTEPSANATGGTAFAQQPVVTVEDAEGNTVTSSSASITLAITSGTGTAGATLTCTTNPLAASSGVATFAGCNINLAGSGYTLKATSGTLTSATSTAITVSVGAPAKLAFTTQPSNTAAGSSITPSPVVSIEDAGGNVVTTASDTITVAIGTNPGSSTLSGTTVQGTTNGAATFSGLSLNKSGTGYTLTATSTNGYTSATSTTFNITAGTAAQLAFTQEPSATASGGTAFATQPKVSVEDANGNVVTTSTASVTLAITSGTGTAGATLTCTTNPVTAAAGVATFAGCSINLDGSNYTLTATSGTLTAGVSTAITVSTGTATKLAFSQQPTNTAASQPITPAVTVQVEDAGGNLVTTSTASITIAIGTNPSSGTLSGTLTVAASGGVATFSNLSINKSGTGYTLKATSGTLTSATSSTFNILAGAESQLVFTVQPSNTAQNIAFSPAVAVSVEDSNGNVVTTSSDSITIAIGTNPSSGTLSGTTTVSATSGVATFNGLSINNLGTGYTLTATDGTTSLPVVTSTTFNIVVPQVTYIQPFNSGHGWTYTQTGCSDGTFGSCSDSASVTTAADCDSEPCVDASVSAGLQEGGDQTGYFHNPSPYTWQTLGVPASTTVTSVAGGWWDLANGCNTGTTAGIQIYDTTNSIEITSGDVYSVIQVSGDTGTRHALGSAVTVNTSYAASSTALTIRFNLNPDTTSLLGTCTLYGDTLELLISYTTASTGSGHRRRGQVIIGFNRDSDGSMNQAFAYNVELLAPNAAPLTPEDVNALMSGRSGTALDPSALETTDRRITPLRTE